MNQECSNIVVVEAAVKVYGEDRECDKNMTVTELKFGC